MQKYVKAMREAGAPVSTYTVIAAARGIISAQDRSLLVENGGYIALSETWAQSTNDGFSSLSGVFLPMQILYASKTDRCHPHYTMPPRFDIWHTPNHWGNTERTIHFIEKVVVPYVNAFREEKHCPNQAALVTFDNFTGHTSEAIQELLEQNRIHSVKVPPGLY